MCDSVSPKTSLQPLVFLQKIVVSSQGRPAVSFVGNRGKQTSRKKGLQHLNGIVLNGRKWGVRNYSCAAGFSWLRINDFEGRSGGKLAFWELPQGCLPFIVI